MLFAVSKMLFKLFFSFSILSDCCFIVNAQSAANFIIERSYPCDDVPNQKVNLTIKPKTFSNPQLLDITLITPIPIGDQLKFILNIDLENNIGLKMWQHLVKLEDDFCRAMHIYMGRVLSDMETAMGILPRGVCPIPKGNYHAVNYTIDYSLMKLQAFPFGRLRLTIKYIEKSSKDTLLCIVTLVNNKQ